MAKDKEIIDAMNLIKNHCRGRICQACACWDEKGMDCIVMSGKEPCTWETEKAKEMD